MKGFSGQPVLGSPIKQILFLVPDACDGDVAVGHVAKPGDIPAGAKINDRLSVIHLAFHGSKALGHHSYFFQCVLDHGDGTTSDFRRRRSAIDCAEYFTDGILAVARLCPLPSCPSTS